jgi:hypothetical protein
MKSSKKGMMYFVYKMFSPPIHKIQDMSQVNLEGSVRDNHNVLSPVMAD